MTLAGKAAVALVLALATSAAHAGPADDAYVAARDKAVAELAAAEKAGATPEDLEKRDTAARSRLQARMAQLLGPLTFKGMKTAPTFSPATLLDGNIETGDPDGLVFSDAEGSTTILVSPEPVLATWLAARGRQEHAPPDFAKGIAAAAKGDDFYTFTVGGGAAFAGYAVLPVVARNGEAASAILGMFSQDITENRMPESVVVLRIADGRVAVAAAPVDIPPKSAPACDAAWKSAAGKVKALRAAAEKSRKEDDPRWEQANTAEGKASDDFRACFAKAVQGTPALAAATKRAEALLEMARGQ